MEHGIAMFRVLTTYRHTGTEYNLSVPLLLIIIDLFRAVWEALHWESCLAPALPEAWPFMALLLAAVAVKDEKVDLEWSPNSPEPLQRAVVAVQAVLGQ